MAYLQPQSIVRRGELAIAFDVINNWDTELKEMDKKIKLIKSHFIILIHLFFSYLAMPRHIFIYHMGRPKTELHNRGNAKGKLLPYIPDFTTINIEE